MSEAEESDLPEIAKVRVRVHRLNDMVQVHVGTLLEHTIKIEHLEKAVVQTVTREQLDTSMTTVGIKMGALGDRMEAAGRLVTEQIKTITDNMTPIRNALYWVVALVMTGVIGGVLALVLKKP